MEYVDLVVNSDEHDGSDGILVEWIKGENQFVEMNDSVAIVETSKVTLEVISPVSGYISSIEKQAGEEVTLDEVIARIKKVKVNPITGHKTHNHLEVSDDEGISPTLSSSRVSESPPKDYLFSSNSFPPGEGVEVSNISSVKPMDRENVLEEKYIDDSRVVHKLSKRQAATAENVHRSLSNTPHVSTFFEASVENILWHKDTCEKKASFTAYYVYCLAQSLLKFPQINSHLVGDKLSIHKRINVGIVVALENDELIVPVIKDVNNKSLSEISADLSVLIDKCNTGALRREDTQDGTITVSNYGVTGSLFATPIVLVEPQVAILGVGAINYRPKSIKSKSGYQIDTCPMIYTSLTINHRAVNGSLANKFMSYLVKNIEEFSAQ